MGEEATIHMLTEFAKIYAFHVLVSHLVARPSPFAILVPETVLMEPFPPSSSPQSSPHSPFSSAHALTNYLIKNVEATLNLSTIFLQHLPVSYWLISMEVSFPVVGLNLLNLYSWCHFHTSFATELHYLISQNPQ